MARTAPIRLAAFALVLLGSFGTAYGLGRRLPGNPESKPHTHGPVKPSPVPTGFHANGYTLFTDATQSSGASIALHITGPDGARVTRFTEEQGAKLHVVLIRFDDSGFEHLTPQPAPQDNVEVDGVRVVRNGLTFAVSASDGSAATGLEPYLGQPAHLFAIRQGDLAHTHLQPIASITPTTFAFTGELPPGTYRLFLQFGYQGGVTTAGFTLVQP